MSGEYHRGNIAGATHYGERKACPVCNPSPWPWIVVAVVWLLATAAYLVAADVAVWIAVAPAAWVAAEIVAHAWASARQRRRS